MKLNLPLSFFGIRTLLVAVSSMAVAAGVTWLALDCSSTPVVTARNTIPAPAPAISSSVTNTGSSKSGQTLSSAIQIPAAATRSTIALSLPRPAAYPTARNQRGGYSTKGATVPQAASTDPDLEPASIITRDTTFVPMNEQPRLSSGPVLLEVTPGIRSPAVLAESDGALSPQATAMKERIAEDFANEVTQAADPETAEVDPVTFDNARNRADERYRMFFGDAAYNQVTMSAAKRAINSGKK